MRHPDPRKRGSVKVGWGVNLKKKHVEKGIANPPLMVEEEPEPTPVPGLLFYPGFLLPLLWFVRQLTLLRESQGFVLVKVQKKTDAYQFVLRHSSLAESGVPLRVLTHVFAIEGQPRQY